MRRKVPRKKDQKLFRKLATRTKKINIKPKLMRGGIRL